MNPTIPNNMSSSEQDVVAAVPDAKPLEQFTLFPKLAIELRLRIWELALPIGPQGQRVLKVATDRIDKITRFKKLAGSTSSPTGAASTDASASTETTSIRLTFRLLDNQPSAEIKDCSLSKTSWESRRAYLRYFTQSLRVGSYGLIRFAKEDLVYICKNNCQAEVPIYMANIESVEMMSLKRTDKFRDCLKQGDEFEAINCRKLVLRSHLFNLRLSFVWKAWCTDTGSVTRVVQDEFIGWITSLISRCMKVEEVGMMIGNWDNRMGEGWYEKYIENHGAESLARLEGENLQSYLDSRDAIRGYLEAGTKHQGQKMQELRVWNMDGNEISLPGS